jgi:hypothetical protein
MTYYMNG